MNRSVRSVVLTGCLHLSFDGEECIGSFDSFGGEQRFLQPGEIEELAPCMRPARDFDNRPWLALGHVKPVEAAEMVFALPSIK